VKVFSLIIIGVVFFVSCKDEIENDPSGIEDNIQYRYFPLDPGSFIVYSVDSVIHRFDDDDTDNPDSLIDNYHYEVMEAVDSSFIDGEGDTAWRISRYYRDSSSADWIFSTLWTAKVTNQSAQRVEENIRYLKISFPIKLNKSWNGNYFNFLPEEDYTIQEVNAPINIGNFSFDSSMTVLETNDDNLLRRIFKESKYAYGIGLISRERDSLNLTDPPFSQVKNGYEIRQTIIDYFPR